jgi:hypothetical protein
MFDNAHDMVDIPEKVTEWVLCYCLCPATKPLDGQILFSFGIEHWVK